MAYCGRALLPNTDRMRGVRLNHADLRAVHLYVNHIWIVTGYCFIWETSCRARRQTLTVRLAHHAGMR